MRNRLLILVAVLVVLGAGGGVFTAMRSSASSSSPRAKVATISSQHPGKKGFQLLSTDPAPGATGVDAGGPYVVSFTQPLALNSPRPVFSPTTFGSWTFSSPSTLVFTPAADLAVGSTVTMTIPGGSNGVRSVHKAHLASSLTVSFTIDPGSTLRLQQLLAQLNYLPVSFTPTPTTAAAVRGPGPASSLAQQGQFQFRWLDFPAQLQTLWQQGANNVISTGALMSFENAHGFTTSNNPTPTSDVWSALLQAASADQVATIPYTWVMVSQALPETATVWQNGASVFSTPVNTGVPGASTATGTYPVFERFTVTTMSGKNPDGSVYHDPGIPDVSYFNGGDALHGFSRSSYGYPQSDGCVEMPFAAAATVYPLTPIGTLVTVL